MISRVFVAATSQLRRHATASVVQFYLQRRLLTYHAHERIVDDTTTVCSATQEAHARTDDVAISAAADAVASTMRFKRTTTCADLSKVAEGQVVTLAGWAECVRGATCSLCFVVLRDETGRAQVVVSGLSDARHTSVESVISVEGRVVKRPERHVREASDSIAPGAFEVHVDKKSSFRVLNHCATVPLPVRPKLNASATDDSGSVNEGSSNSLKFRFLALRRDEMQRSLRARSRALQAARACLVNSKCVEIETPTLFKSTPEGAREFLVPSRHAPGEFYALAQSPQQYKQILMASGFERYFQIARCYRDEDPRADRQPEFTQIDIELAFESRHAIMNLVQRTVLEIARAVDNVKDEIKLDIPSITFAQAMELYGSDKPDLRVPLKVIKIANADFQGMESFALHLSANELCVSLKTALQMLSKPMKAELTRVAEKHGIECSHLFFGTVGRYNKNSKAAPCELNEAWASDDILCIWKKPADVDMDDFYARGSTPLGDLRNYLIRLCAGGQEKLLKSCTDRAFVWVTEFPLFLSVKDTNKFVPAHHPFTAPEPDDVASLYKLICKKHSAQDSQALDKKLVSIRGQHYDLVLNGAEIAGGSLRIHNEALQRRVFDAIGISETEAEAAFGHLLSAQRLGCPPHGGAAIGFDRLICELLKKNSLRQVIAFPKSGETCRDQMVGAPAPLADADLVPWLKIHGNSAPSSSS